MASSPYGSGGYIRKPDFAVNDKSATPTDTGMDGQFVRDYFMDDEKDRKRLTPTDTELDRQIDELDALIRGFENWCTRSGFANEPIINRTDFKAQLKQLIARERLEELRVAEKNGQLRNQDEWLPMFIHHEEYIAHRETALQAQADKEQG